MTQQAYLYASKPVSVKDQSDGSFSDSSPTLYSIDKGGFVGIMIGQYKDSNGNLWLQVYSSKTGKAYINSMDGSYVQIYPTDKGTDPLDNPFYNKLNNMASPPGPKQKPQGTPNPIAPPEGTTDRNNDSTTSEPFFKRKWVVVTSVSLILIFAAGIVYKIWKNKKQS